MLVGIIKRPFSRTALAVILAGLTASTPGNAAAVSSDSAAQPADLPNLAASVLMSGDLRPGFQLNTQPGFSWAQPDAMRLRVGGESGRLVSFNSYAAVFDREILGTAGLQSGGPVRFVLYLVASDVPIAQAAFGSPEQAGPVEAPAGAIEAIVDHALDGLWVIVDGAVRPNSLEPLSGPGAEDGFEWRAARVVVAQVPVVYQAVGFRLPAGAGVLMTQSGISQADPQESLSLARIVIDRLSRLAAGGESRCFPHELFVNAEHGYSFCYPAVSEGLVANATLDERDSTFVRLTFGDVALIGVHVGPAGSRTLDEYAGEFFAGYGASLPGFANPTTRWIELRGGLPAYEMVNEVGPGGRSRKVLIVDAGRTILIDAETYLTLWDLLESDFDLVISSFELTP
jgi:hypothetical protein